MNQNLSISINPLIELLIRLLRLIDIDLMRDDE